jgi:hypothetical protein
MSMLNIRISTYGSSRSIRRAASNTLRRGNLIVHYHNLWPHLGGASDRFLPIGGSSTNFPPVRRDGSGKVDPNHGVMIGNDDTGDAIRCHALNGKTEFAGERLRRILKSLSGGC